MDGTAVVNNFNGRSINGKDSFRGTFIIQSTNGDTTNSHAQGEIITQTAVIDQLNRRQDDCNEQKEYGNPSK